MENSVGNRKVRGNEHSVAQRSEHSIAYSIAHSNIHCNARRNSHCTDQSFEQSNSHSMHQSVECHDFVGISEPLMGQDIAYESMRVINSMNETDSNAVAVEQKIEYYLGPVPKRVAASAYKPNSRAKLPRIDSRSEGFEELPEHVKSKIYEREELEREIRKAAESLIKDEDRLDLKPHMLIKWRYKTAVYLIEQHPQWAPALIKKMVGISKDEFYYYDNNPQCLDRYDEIKKCVMECFEIHGKGKAGFRRMTVLLKKHYGISLSQPTVRKYMHELGIKGSN